MSSRSTLKGTTTISLFGSVSLYTLSMVLRKTSKSSITDLFVSACFAVFNNQRKSAHNMKWRIYNFFFLFNWLIIFSWLGRRVFFFTYMQHYWGEGASVIPLCDSFVLFLSFVFVLGSLFSCSFFFAGSFFVGSLSFSLSLLLFAFFCCCSWSLLVEVDFALVSMDFLVFLAGDLSSSFWDSSSSSVSLAFLFSA